MAGTRGMKWARYNRWTRFWRITVPNLVNDIRIKRWAEKNEIHRGQRQILTGGVWVDNDRILYNRMGQPVGKIEWNEGHGG